MAIQLECIYLVKETCISCGVIFGIESSYHAKVKSEHRNFHCPNGHTQYCPAKSDKEILQDQLTRERALSDQLRAANDNMRTRLKHSELSRLAHKGHLTRIKNRIKNGVCPCCNRTFRNLQAHMTTKHPDYPIVP